MDREAPVEAMKRGLVRVTMNDGSKETSRRTPPYRQYEISQLTAFSYAYSYSAAGGTRTRRSLPIEYEYEYRFTEYEYDLDTLVCGVQREVSKSTLKSLNKTF